MKIFLYPRNVYGQELLYPVSNDSSWEQVTGKKTFSKSLCDSLTQLGFEMVIHEHYFSWLGCEICHQSSDIEDIEDIEGYENLEQAHKDKRNLIDFAVCSTCLMNES